MDMVVQRDTDGGVDARAGEHRDELTARGQQQVDEAGTAAATSSPTINTSSPAIRGRRPACTCPPTSTPPRSPPVPTPCRHAAAAGHGVTVVDGLRPGVVHRQRGQPLHHGPPGTGTRRCPIRWPPCSPRRVPRRRRSRWAAPSPALAPTSTSSRTRCWALIGPAGVGRSTSRPPPANRPRRTVTVDDREHRTGPRPPARRPGPPRHQ